MNEIRNALLDYYLDPNTIVELYKKYQHDKIDSVINKYAKDISSIDQITGNIETYRNTKNSSLEETIAKRVKLMPRDRKR